MQTWRKGIISLQRLRCMAEEFSSSSSSCRCLRHRAALTLSKNIRLSAVSEFYNVGNISPRTDDVSAGLTPNDDAIRTNVCPKSRLAAESLPLHQFRSRREWGEQLPTLAALMPRSHAEVDELLSC